MPHVHRPQLVVDLSVVQRNVVDRRQLYWDPIRLPPSPPRPLHRYQVRLQPHLFVMDLPVRPAAATAAVVVVL